MNIRVLGLVWLTIAVAPVWASQPELLGYGVRSCTEFRSAYQGWEKGEEKAVAEYYRYQDWLTGFISGLSLVTGDDQLRGVSIQAVLRRNNLHCQEQINDDFFSATMALIKDLKKLP